MKKFIHLIIFISVPYLFYSQDIRFNNTYSANYAPLFSNVLIGNNGYIGLGGDYFFGKLHIYILKVDTIGNILWTKHYGDTIYDYYHGTRNSLIKNSDGGYSLAGSCDNDTIDMCKLYKFDQNFDTLWTRSYFVDTNFTVFYNHIQTADGGYALVGCYDNSTNYDGDVLLVKTDSLGNMQWYRTYGTTGAYSTDYGFCIVATPDGGYLIGGSTKYAGKPDGYLIKTDSLGNEEWTRHYGNPNYPDGSIYNIQQTHDSGYVFGLSSYAMSQISASFYDYKYNIIKLNKDFNLLWNKQYGEKDMYTGLASVIESTDGHLLVTIVDAHISGLFKLTANGDSIWKRYYYPPDTNMYDNNFLALKQTQDGGFIMAGVAYPPQQMWLVKVDSCGCDTAGCCNTGIPYYFLPAPEVTIYPNPATDNLTIVITNYELRITSVSIYDIMGEQVKSIKINAQSENYNIDVKNLPAGVYFVKVETNKGMVVKKLIIND